jgi:hypothetical protein
MFVRRKNLMRSSSLLILAALGAGMAVATAPVSAQTYDPRYPICKRVNSDAASIDCYYTTMEQCKEDARGESAECVVNPYFKTAREEPAAPAPAPARSARH